MVTVTPHNRVRYFLEHHLFGKMQIDEPEGWDTDEKEIARNEQYHGVFAKFSNSLKFKGQAKELIEMVEEAEGINAVLRLTKDERHPVTDLWERSYDGYLDMSTMEIEEYSLSIKFNSGGLEPILKAKESEQLEIERETTLSGRVMAPLQTELVELEGRRIFLDTRYKLGAPDDVEFTYVESNGNRRTDSVGVPFKITEDSHEDLSLSVLPGSHGNVDNGTVGMIFFGPADRERILNVEFEMYFIPEIFTWARVNSAYFALAVVRYKYNNGDMNRLGPIAVLYETDPQNDPDNNIGSTIWPDSPETPQTVSFNQQITLQPDEMISVEFILDANIGTTFNEGYLGIRARNMTGTMRITEDSFFEKTQTKTVLAHELMNRIVEIITDGADNFKSDFFGRTDIGYPVDGPGALTGHSHGFWVRGFDAIPAGTPETPNPYKPITTSWKDCMQSHIAVWNVGMGIEKTGFKERIVVEDRRHFYNGNVTITLPNQINKPKRTYATKEFFSSVEIGYEKGGSYEEALGLDEYNGKSVFSSIITRVTGVYMQISKYRADSYGLEFARRKPKASNPTRDTGYDQDVFLLDLKRGVSNVFKTLRGSDGLDEMPEGTYSPETAMNVQLSPVNMLMRHGWVIAASLIKYPTDYLRYGSSTANSQLKSKLIGQPKRGENEDILNSELSRARTNNKYIEFEHVVDFNIMRAVEGYTIINGKRVENVYGLVEFINEFGQKEKGWLVNLKPNGAGKWKLLLRN